MLLKFIKHLKPKSSWVTFRTHRKIKFFIISFFIVGSIPLFFYVRWALGASAVWTNGGGDGLWSNCANWSGGTGTGGCPGVNDVATFNNTSVANAAIDASISVKGISIASNYTGIITQNSGKTITIGSSGYTQAGGTFTGGDSSITLNSATGNFSLTNGTFTNTSATMSIAKDMTVSGGSFSSPGTVSFTGTSGATSTLTCSGTFPGTVDINQGISNETFINSANCSITLPASVTTTGSITNNGTMTATNISTASNFTQSGTLNLSGTLTLTGSSGGTQTITCSGIFPGTVDDTQGISNETVAIAAGCSVTFPSTVTTTGSITNNGTINANNINISHDFTQNGALNISGTVTFTTSSGITATLTCTGNFPGTVDDTQSISNETLVIASGCAATFASTVTTTGSITNNGTINATTINIGHDFTQNGTLNLTGTLNFNVNSNTAQTLSCTGNLTNSGGVANISQSFSTSQQFTLASGCTATFSASASTQGSLTVNGTMNATNLTIGKNLTITGTLNLPGTLTINQNIDTTISCSSSPIVGAIVVTKGNAARNFILASDCTVGDFTLTTGTISNTASPYTLSVMGNFAQNSNTSIGGTFLTLAFTGNRSQTISQSTGTINTNVQVNKTGGTATLSTNLNTSGSATISAGTLFLNTKAFTAGQGFTVQNGGNLQLVGTETPTTPTLASGSTVTFVGNGDSSANSYTAPNWTYSNFTVNMTDSNDTVNPPGSPFTIGGSFTESGGIFSAPAVFNIAGSFSHSGGTFTTNNGLVNLNGTNQKLYGNTTFYDLTKATSNDDTLTFESGKTQTVSHTATLTGSPGAPLRLFATSPGTQAKFDPQTTRTFSYLNVKDNNNVNATIISTAGLNINNVGDNTNWDFTGRPIDSFHVSGTHIGSGTHITTR